MTSRYFCSTMRRLSLRVKVRLPLSTVKSSGSSAKRFAFGKLRGAGPIDALVDFRREVLDFRIGKVLPGGKDAAQENGTIDGGKLALLPPLARLHMNEVEEKSMRADDCVFWLRQDPPVKRRRAWSSSTYR